MTRWRLGRRAFLRGAGGIAVSLPLLEAMRPPGRSGWAAKMVPPKRFVVFFTPNGTIRENWLPVGTETAFSMSRILAPLESNKQSVVILDGIDNQVGGYNARPGDDHMKGMGTMLTGTGLLPGPVQVSEGAAAGLGGGISVDQTIAGAIGAGTKFRSLEFGVQTGDGGTVESYASYAAANQPLPPDNDPASVWTRVFYGLGGQDPAIQRRQAERKSVLDAVMESYAQLNPRLGASDKAKLEAHLTTIRDLESRLTATGTLGGSCIAPPTPATIDCKANDNFPIVGRLQLDLLVMALACDLTRVATIQWEKSIGDARFTWLGTGVTRGHHDLSHDGDSNTATIETLTQINAWYAQQLNYLIDALRGATDADGATLLDNTLIVWVNELSRGNVHSHDHMPYLLAGGAGGSLRGGRFLTYDGVPHNNLLVSCMNLLGLPGSTFGDPSFCTGPLTGL